MQSFAQNSKTPVKFQINSRKLTLRNDQFKRTLKKEIHHKKKTLNYSDLPVSEDSSKSKDTHSNQILLTNQLEKNSCTERKNKSFDASSETTACHIPNKTVFADEKNKTGDSITNKDKYDPFFDDDDDDVSKMTPKHFSPSHSQTTKVGDKKSKKHSPEASSPNKIVQYPLHMLNSTKETNDDKINDKKEHKKHGSKFDETKSKEKSKNSKDHDKRNRKSHKENYDNDNYSDKSKSKYRDKYNDDYDDYYYKRSTYNHYGDENHDKDHYSHHKHTDRYESIKFHREVARSYRNRSRSNSSNRYDSLGYYSKESRHKSPSPEVHRRYLDDRHDNGSYSKRRYKRYEKDYYDYNDYRLHDRKYDKDYQKSRHKLTSVSPESDSKREYRRDRTHHHRHLSKEKSSSSSSVMLLDNDFENTTISINDNSFSPKSHRYDTNCHKKRSSDYLKKCEERLNKSIDVVLDEIPLPGSNGDFDEKHKVSDVGKDNLNEVKVSKGGYDLDDIPIPASNGYKNHKDKNKLYEKDEISSQTNNNKKFNEHKNFSKNKLKSENNSKILHSNHIKFNETQKKDSKIVFSMKDANKLKAFHNHKQAIFEEESDNEKDSKTSSSKVSQSTVSSIPTITTSFLPFFPKTDKTNDLKKNEIYDPIGESTPKKSEFKSVPPLKHQSDSKLPFKDVCDTRSHNKLESKQAISIESSLLISSTVPSVYSHTDKGVSETSSNTSLYVDTINENVPNNSDNSKISEPIITKNTNYSVSPQTNISHIKEEERHLRINKEFHVYKEKTTIKPKEKRRSRFGDPVKHPKPHKTTQDILPITSTQSISTNSFQSTMNFVDSTSNISYSINESLDNELAAFENSLERKSMDLSGFSNLPSNVSKQYNEEVCMDVEKSIKSESSDDIVKNAFPSKTKIHDKNVTGHTAASNDLPLNGIINEVDATLLTQLNPSSTTVATDVSTMHTTTTSVDEANENSLGISTVSIDTKIDTADTPNVNYSKSLENINYACKGTPNTFNNCPNIKMKIKMQCVWNSVSACDQPSQFDYSNLNRTVSVENKKVEEVVDSNTTKPINETTVSNNITSNIINDTPPTPLSQAIISTPISKRAETIEKKGTSLSVKGGRRSNKEANETGKKVERRRSSRIKSKQDNKMKENKIQEYKNSIQNNNFYLKNKGNKISDLITIINNEKENVMNTSTNQPFIPSKEAPTTSTVKEEAKGETYKPEKVKSRWRRWSELESDESSSQSQTSKLPLTQAVLNDDKPSDAPPPTDVVPDAKNEADTKIKDEEKVDEVKEDEDDSNAKPTPYISIEENVYLSERDIKKQKKESRRMVCDCELKELSEGVIDPSSACGAECLNRMLMIECGSRCPCKEYCNNRQFTQMKYAKTKCFRTPWKGWGLQADEDMPIGTFIMEYVGEVLEYKEFKSRTKRYNKENIQHHYFMALNVEQVIDATKKGNASRFINHCCDPNAETQKWTVNGQLRVGFFVVKPIKKSEEITFNYQFENYGEEKIKCYCDSSKCTGFIGGNKNTPFKLRKSSKTKKKKIIELFSDLHLEREVEAMASLGGLRRKQHVLELNRIMLRADNVEHRLALLKVLQNTKEPACLRLFLDYHGLSLLWSWMVGGHADDGFKKQIIETLKLLPINNRTCLKNSKVLSVIEKWASTTHASATTNATVATPSATDLTTASSTPSTTTISGAETSSTTSVVTSSLNDPVPPSTVSPEMPLLDTKATKEQPIISDKIDDVMADDNNDNGDRNINSDDTNNKGREESMEVDDDFVGVKKDKPDGVFEGGDDNDSNKDVDNDNIDKDNNTDNKDILDTEENASDKSEGDKVTSGKGGEDEESGVDNEDDGGTDKGKNDEDIGNDYDDNNNKDYGAKDKINNGNKDENKTDAENHHNITAVDKDTDKETNNKAHTDIQADPPAKEEGNDDDGKDDDVSVREDKEVVDIISMANSLLEAWSDLKEGFKIPKMKVEERKKTELELDEQCDKKNSKGWDKGVLKRSLDEFGLSNHDSIKIKKKKVNEADKNKNKTSVSSSSSDNLIKLEHRQQFEAKVRAEEMEKAAKQHQQQQIQLQQQLLKQQFFANKSTMYQSPIMNDNKQQSYPISTIIKNHQHIVNTTSAEAYKQEQFYIPSIASNSLQPQPPFISPIVEPPFMPTAISTTNNNNINTFNNFDNAPTFNSNNNIPCFLNYPHVDDYNMGHHLQEMPQQSMYPLQPYPVPPQHPLPPQPHALPPQQPPYFMPPNDMSYNNNSNDNSINKANMFSPPNRNINPAVNSKNIKVIDLQEPPPPPSTPPKQLPPHWKSAKDSSGKVYYYHAITRKTQWDPPMWDAVSNQNTPREVKPHQAMPTQKKHSTTTTAAADTSSSAEVVKRKRDVFKEKVSKVVISCLNPYRRPDCSKARICNNDDFKYLARKLTHAVLMKEEKCCKQAQNLEYNDSVKLKAKDYIHKYMTKFSDVYTRTCTDVVDKVKKADYTLKDDEPKKGIKSAKDSS